MILYKIEDCILYYLYDLQFCLRYFESKRVGIVFPVRVILVSCKLLHPILFSLIGGSEMERILLPAIYCPFPPAINPLVEEVHKHSLEWVKRTGLIQKEVALQRFAAARFAWIAARAHPEATLDDLNLAADWQVWLFMFDDQFDDGAIGKEPERMSPILNDLLAMVMQPPLVAPERPVANALYDFWKRACSCTSRFWQARFTSHLADYFASYSWEALNRQANTIPSVKTYITNRRNSGSLATVFDLIDITQHVELPPHVYGSPEVQTLLRTASNVVCWVNDLFSFPKERARGELNNLVLVVQNAHCCSLPEAVKRVNDMITEEVRLFIETERNLPSYSPEIDEGLQRYLVDVRAWMRGNLDWSQETPRYSQVEYTDPGQSVSYLESIL
jgi:hypothetical protein